MKQFFLTLTLLFFSFSASAGWPTIEGQLVDSLGEPILETDVDFKVEISTVSDCEMVEEEFNNSGNGYNLSDSRGSFALMLGNGSQNFHGSSSSYDDVFGIQASVTGEGACSASTSAGDSRHIHVSYSLDSGSTWNLISSPMVYGGAASAATLNGIPESQFLKARDDASHDLNQANLEWLFESATRFPELQALISGTSTQYATSAGTGEANDGANVGAGTGQIYKDKTGTDINFKSIAAGSTRISVTNNTDDVTLDVVESNIDHDSLSGFVTDEHIDHSSVSIATAADSGLSGGGDITSTRNLAVDVNGTTAETSVANTDALLIYDASATALRKMTRTNFVLSESEVDAFVGNNGYLTSESDPGLQTLTIAEVDQLENIGAITISATQWGYLGAMSGQPLEVAPPPGPMQTDEPSGATTGEWELIGNSGEASSFLFRVAPVTPATGNGAYSEAQGVCAGISSQTNRGIAKLCSIEQLQRACVEDKLNDDNGGLGQDHASSNLSGATSVFSLYILDGSVDNNYSNCQVVGNNVNFSGTPQKFYCCIE